VLRQERNTQLPSAQVVVVALVHPQQLLGQMAAIQHLAPLRLLEVAGVELAAGLALLEQMVALVVEVGQYLLLVLLALETLLLLLLHRVTMAVLE
jgi:hypothetical protein